MEKESVPTIRFGREEMKLFVASDIHGSAHYCRKMLEAYDREKPDRMLLLGDILYHGPRNDLPEEYAPKKVIEMLNERKNDIICVRGNCEAEVDQMVLEFPVLADYGVFDLGKRILYATHGHIYNQKNPLPLRKGDILIHGHTHVPKFKESDGIYYMNPGSVSIPKKDSHHGYMTIENGEFIWKDLSGTVMRREILS